MITVNQWHTQNFIFWWYKFNCGAGVSHSMYLAGWRSCCPVPLRNNAEQQFWRYKLYSLGSTLQKQLGLLDLCTSVKQSERLKLVDAIYWKLWKTETLILQTGHRQRLRPVESNHFRWPVTTTRDLQRHSSVASLSHAIFRTVVQQLTRFKWHGSSRGPSAIAELLANFVTLIVTLFG